MPSIMQVINIVLVMFSSIRTRREVRCTITRAAIGNRGVGMCSCTIYLYFYVCETENCVRRGTGQCIFCEHEMNGRPLNSAACLGTKFCQRSASFSIFT